MNNNTDPNATTANNANGTQQNQRKVFDPLFGPALGMVTQGPPWTISNEKKVLTDDLTPEVVSGWVEKSKEPSQPTTTLQALVNLKRPSLRLSPLTSSEEDPSHEHHHGLEFEYDCDAPKCGIYVYVFLPKDHPDAHSTHYPMAKLLVFETVVEGGFGRTLKLEEGAVLELGRWEYVPGRAPAAEASSLAPVPEAMSPNGSGDSTSSPTPRPNSSTNGSGNGNHHRRRFTHFHFRKRSQNRSVSGPALAVVDAEPQETATTTKKEGTGENKDETMEGVRVTIRLAALDEQGAELASPNEQVTYLHVVRFGAKPAATEGEEADEDTRPWVVKVVKREATIGPHTFQLHEIYGLTSSSTHTYAPTSQLPATPHTYPPDVSSPPVQPAPAEEDDPQSECLLCLSEPREVVLLPCRHLVACKDCAVNMVEFGAGGNITQAVETTAAPAESPSEGEANPQGEGGSAAPATVATPTPITPTTNPRRKRKAKGWFCPVCRQPYTSLLRITTSPPPPATSKDESRSSGEEDSPAGAAPAIATTETSGNGLLGGMLRPGFLRGLSLRAGAVPPDVESNAGLGRQGA